MSALRTLPISSRKADERFARVMRLLAPVAVMAASTAIWSLIVRLNNIPPYVLPGPEAVFTTLIDDRQILFGSLLVTLRTTLRDFSRPRPAASCWRCCSISRNGWKFRCSLMR